MPFVPSFAVSQTLGYPENVNFTDTSTGSDAAIASRRIYVQVDDGSYLVETGTATDYEVWAYADDSITLDLLSKDYATLITVQWLDVNNAVLYTSQEYAGFALYNQTFLYQLTQWLAGNPLNINDNNYFSSLSELRDCVDSGNQAVEFISDLYAAQQCYDRGTAIRLNSQYVFNTNS